MSGQSGNPKQRNTMAHLPSVGLVQLCRYRHGHAQLCLASAELAVHFGDRLGLESAAEDGVKLGRARCNTKAVLLIHLNLRRRLELASRRRAKLSCCAQDARIARIRHALDPEHFFLGGHLQCFHRANARFAQLLDVRNVDPLLLQSVCRDATFVEAGTRLSGDTFWRSAERHDTNNVPMRFAAAGAFSLPPTSRPAPARFS